MGGWPQQDFCGASYSGIPWRGGAGGPWWAEGEGGPVGMEAPVVFSLQHPNPGCLGVETLAFYWKSRIVRTFFLMSE